MSSQRYERVSTTDAQDHVSSQAVAAPGGAVPASPPPSFRSAASSPTTRHFPEQTSRNADRALADSFDPSDGEESDDGDEADDRQRLMRGQAAEHASDGTNPRDGMQRRMTQLPQFAPTATNASSGLRNQNDGVFANMDAKPQASEKVEQPPTYEQAAADATPPYWESTVMVPGGVSPDEVYIDGLPVGSVFAFLWNGMISMSFQVVGFLLTYLLHTTHAAKNGSRAGLGITMIQYGFYLKGSGKSSSDADINSVSGAPPDPNSHEFNPSIVDATLADTASGVNGSDILAYAMMVVGWFILIRAVSDFLRARHMKAVVMQTPDRGLGLAVVGEGEHAETAV